MIFGSRLSSAASSNREEGRSMSEAFVQLMRTYCIDYTNSHDLSVCDAIMDPDYVVYITGMSLGRDSAYKPSVAQVFERFPNLGLAVHEFVTNGDRLAMRFSEHAADTSGGLACWPGIGLYDWNGSQLTTCRVEQDFWSQQRQLDSGVPDALEPPHLDPWTTTTASPSQRAAEQVAREWLVAGDLSPPTTPPWSKRPPPLFTTCSQPATGWRSTPRSPAPTAVASAPTSPDPRGTRRGSTWPASSASPAARWMMPAW
jgi:predicted ester cyclase